MRITTYTILILLLLSASIGSARTQQPAKVAATPTPAPATTIPLTAERSQQIEQLTKAFPLVGTEQELREQIVALRKALIQAEYRAVIAEAKLNANPCCPDCAVAPDNRSLIRPAPKAEVKP